MKELIFFMNEIGTNKFFTGKPILLNLLSIY